MAENSKIEWAHHTFNPWRGCQRVSEGCRNCYAETMSGRGPQVLGRWGPNGTRVVAAEKQWTDPVKWDRWAAAGTCYHCHGKSTRPTPGRCPVCDGTGNIGPYRGRVFCASPADVFEDWPGQMTDVGGNPVYRCDACRSSCWSRDGRTCDGCGTRAVPYTMHDARHRLFDMIARTPHLDWLLLTKRPSNVLPFTRRAIDPFYGPTGNEQGEPNGLDVAPLALLFPNLWIGTSVEDQPRADERTPELLKIPAAAHFLSGEPLLGALDLVRYLPNTFTGFPRGPRLSWVIVGGESGTGARECDVAWLRSVREQCRASGVPFFCKQLGAQAVEHARGTMTARLLKTARAADRVTGKWEARRALPLLDKKGGNPDEWPADLRVRQFPARAAA